MSNYIEIEYLINLYFKLVKKFESYLSHLNNIIDISYTNGNGYNSSTLYNYSNYGIYFINPNDISELWSGKVGYLTAASKLDSFLYFYMSKYKKLLLFIFIFYVVFSTSIHFCNKYIHYL